MRRRTDKVAKKRTAPKKKRAPAAGLANAALPLGKALQGLLAMTELLRTVGGEFSAAESPRIILSGSGVEMRFGNGEAGRQSAPQESKSNPELPVELQEKLKPLMARMARLEKRPTAAPEEWFKRVEKGLEDVRQATAALQEAVGRDVRNIERELATHSDAINSVRAAVTQNEELFETLVESLGYTDGLTLDQDEQLEPAALAS